MYIRTWWNSPALFLLVMYKEYLNHTLGLTLLTPGLVKLFKVVHGRHGKHGGRGGWEGEFWGGLSGGRGVESGGGL